MLKLATGVRIVSPTVMLECPLLSFFGSGMIVIFFAYVVLSISYGSPPDNGIISHVELI